jgi:hypothetical protein
MTRLLIIVVVWLAVAVIAALAIGRAIRLADEKQRQQPDAPSFRRDGEHGAPSAPTSNADLDRSAPESPAPRPRPAPDDATKRARGRRDR